MNGDLIDVCGLDVTFHSRGRPVAAVKGASFQVRPGEAYGLVGESGSGKTTLLRAVAGLVPEISAGAVRVDGVELGAKRDKAFRRNVQMVFQDPFGSLHPRHSVDRTLREPLEIHGLDDKDGRVRRALEEVGLDQSFRWRYPHQLSGGQRQRVAIARALVLEPRILLLDEPTSALDVSVQAEILNLLKGLKAKHDLTMVLVSHNLSVVGYLCDRLSVMKEGVIVERLSAEALRRGEVAEDYTAQLLSAARGYDRKLVETLVF